MAEGLVVAAQAMLIIGLVLERRRRQQVERALQQRLEFETLVSELSASMSMVRPDERPRVVTRWVPRLAPCLEVDRVMLLSATNGWNGSAPTWSNGSAYPKADFPALAESVTRGELVRFCSLERLPSTLARDRQAFLCRGIESALLIPLRRDGDVVGALALDTTRAHGWPDALVARLEFVAAILTHGLSPQERTVDAPRPGKVRDHENEIAHFAAVGTLGGFALSLAHELNQPLAAILSNAQAARRFLAAPDPQIDEVRAIIDDIDADDRRAGELIHGMRALLKQHTVEMALHDLNEIVREVMRLLHGDFLLRRVALVLDLEAPLPAVRCDKVQIQQVLMNVMMNGFEAMQHTATLDRRMIIRTHAGADGCCVISIRDAGSGIAAAGLGRVFEQFFSTKPDGLGMGLSIARSIVESLGGRIWATNNSDVGATFHVALPIAPAQEAA